MGTSHLLFALAFAGGLTVWGSRRAGKSLLHPSMNVPLAYFALALSSLVAPPSVLPFVEAPPSGAVFFAYASLQAIALLPAITIRQPDATLVLRARGLLWLLRVSAPFVFFSWVVLLPPAVVAMKRGASDVRTTLAEQQPYEEGFTTTAAVAVATFYPAFCLMLGAAIIQRAGGITIAVGVAGALLGVVHAMGYAARDGVLWVGYCLALVYWVGGSIWSLRERLWVRRGAVLGSTLALSYLAIVTWDRFAEREKGLVEGIALYFGAQPRVFAETVAQQTEFYGWSLRFPVIANVLGELRPIVRDTPWQWNFGTFVCDFYSVSGWVSAFGLTTTVCVGTIALLRLCRRRSGLAYTVAVMLYCQFMIQGLFFFRQGSRAGNVYHLVTIMTILVLCLIGRDTRGRAVKSTEEIRWGAVPRDPRDRK